MNIINESACKNAFSYNVDMNEVIKKAEEEIRQIYANEETRKREEKIRKQKEAEEQKKKAQALKERNQLLESSVDNFAKYFATFLTDDAAAKKEFIKGFKETFMDKMDDFEVLNRSASNMAKTFKKYKAATDQASPKKDDAESRADYAKTMNAYIDEGRDILCTIFGLPTTF